MFFAYRVIIYINDIIDNIESEILLFADDTSILVSGKDTETTSNILNNDLKKIAEWSIKWKVIFNADKSKQVIFSRNDIINSPPIILNNEPIERVSTHKHLGVTLSQNLDWSTHIHNVCLKANRKLSVLRRVKLLTRATLDVLYKVTVRSVIDYGLPLFYNSLKITDKARLDKVQYTAGKIVTGALNLTSKHKLDEDLAWENIQTRADFLGLSIFHKIATGDTRPFIRSCMPSRNLSDQTRSDGFVHFPYTKEYHSNSFFPTFTRKYNKINKEIRNSNITDFKIQLSLQLKPKKRKHYSQGPKFSNTLLCQIRVGRSYLKSHSFSIGLAETNTCSCDTTTPETSLHYFINCPLFTDARRILFDQVEQSFIPNFKKISKKRQLEILLQGFEPENHEMRKINAKIIKQTQFFILKTERFPNPIYI